MKSFLGWLMLLVALAVPVFLFYNWWMQMQAQPAPLEASQQVPEEKPFGKLRSVKGGIQNPIQPSTMTANGAKTTPAGDGAVAQASAAERRPAGDPPGKKADLTQGPDANAGADSTNRGQANPMAANPAQQRKKTNSRSRKNKGVEYKQPERDPMLSIMDIKLLRYYEDSKRKALEPPKCKRGEVLKKGRCVKRRLPTVKKTPPVWKEITVQGIIGMATGGRAAIVNDEVRYVGDSVKGATIRKITASTVIFRFKGKTFYKKME
jgi:hypothetical protein